MRLPVPYKVVGTIDTNLISNLVNAIADEDWFVYDYRRPKGNMSDCRSIPLRHSSEYKTSSVREMPLFDKFQPAIEPILEALRAHYSFDNYVSFMALLIPGGVIGDHKDVGEFLETVHRVHVPLTTNPDCFYRVDGTKLQMKVGTIYEIDNQRTHGVENNGDTSRIHLVINLYPKP